MIVKTPFGFIRRIEIAKHLDETNELVSRAYLIIFERPNGYRIGLVEDVWTEEKFRKQGHASEVIKELIQTAKDNKCYKICLSCNLKNTIFYKNFGFREYEHSMRLDL